MPFIDTKKAGGNMREDGIWEGLLIWQVWKGEYKELEIFTKDDKCAKIWTKINNSMVSDKEADRKVSCCHHSSTP